MIHVIEFASSDKAARLGGEGRGKFLITFSGSFILFLVGIRLKCHCLSLLGLSVPVPELNVTIYKLLKLMKQTLFLNCCENIDIHAYLRNWCITLLPQGQAYM